MNECFKCSTVSCAADDVDDDGVRARLSLSFSLSILTSDRLVSASNQLVVLLLLLLLLISWPHHFSLSS